jgi:pimeloyl-ACP methyl ester carboxylesterase
MIGADVPDGVMEPPGEEITRALFGNDLSDEDWAEFSSGIVPEAAGIFNATLGGYPTGIPITYVRMERGIPVPPPFADQMAANLGDDVALRTIDAGHSVMISQPAALAAIINAAVV